jgi:hypothetical protein
MAQCLGEGDLPTLSVASNGWQTDTLEIVVVAQWRNCPSICLAEQEKYKNIQSRYLVPEERFEASTSQVRAYSVTATSTRLLMLMSVEYKLL